MSIARILQWPPIMPLLFRKCAVKRAVKIAREIASLGELQVVDVGVGTLGVFASFRLKKPCPYATAFGRRIEPYRYHNFREESWWVHIRPSHFKLDDRVFDPYRVKYISFNFSEQPLSKNYERDVSSYLRIQIVR